MITYKYRAAFMHLSTIREFHCEFEFLNATVKINQTQWIELAEMTDDVGDGATGSIT